MYHRHGDYGAAGAQRLIFTATQITYAESSTLTEHCARGQLLDSTKKPCQNDHPRVSRYIDPAGMHPGVLPGTSAKLSIGLGQGTRSQ